MIKSFIINILERLLEKLTDSSVYYLNSNSACFVCDIGDIENAQIGIPNYVETDNINEYNNCKIITVTFVKLMNSVKFRQDMLREYDSLVNDKNK